MRHFVTRLRQPPVQDRQPQDHPPARGRAARAPAEHLSRWRGHAAVTCMRRRTGGDAMLFDLEYLP